MSSEPTSDPLAYLDQLTATVEELGRSRWILGQLITLADDAPGLTDAQLRDRLLALAERAHQSPGPGALVKADPDQITASSDAVDGSRVPEPEFGATCRRAGLDDPDPPGGAALPR